MKALVHINPPTTIANQKTINTYLSPLSSSSTKRSTKGLLWPMEAEGEELLKERNYCHGGYAWFTNFVSSKVSIVPLPLGEARRRARTRDPD
jgi:hypothetical protein